MNFKEGIRYGFISLGILLYLYLLGLPKTLGSPAIFIFTLVVGLMSLLFLRNRPHTPIRSLKNTLLNGLLIGLISGVGLALVTYMFASLQAQGKQANAVFAQVTPDHIGAMTGLTKPEVLAGENVIPGLVKLVSFITVAALAGSALTRLSTQRFKAQMETERGGAIRSWGMFTLPFIFFALFLSLRLNGVEVGGNEENKVGLVLLYLFIGAALFSIRAIQPGRQKTILVILLVVLVLLIPQLADLEQNAILGMVAYFIIMGIGLNIVVGYAGLLDLGYVAFFAVGAYTYALLSAPESYVVLNIPGFEGINFWLGVLIAILMGTLAGILLGIPVLRMRGDYLAIVTLGFGEIIRLLVLNLREYTGGPGGVLEIPSPILFGYNLGNPRGILYLAMAFAVIVTFFTIRLRDSRLGRAWVALREDEDVAQAMGINLVGIKLMAFAAGAAFAALGGTIYAARQTNIFPDNFALDVSINVLSLIIIGGIGSIDGVILGAIALIGLPEVLRGVDEYRIVAFGALLVAMMIIRPEGLLPSSRQRRELHADEESLGEAAAEA